MAEEEKVCVRATLRAHKKRYKTVLWILDSNCEDMIEPKLGDIWEIQLVKKIHKEEFLKSANKS